MTTTNASPTPNETPSLANANEDALRAIARARASVRNARECVRKANARVDSERATRDGGRTTPATTTTEMTNGRTKKGKKSKTRELIERHARALRREVTGETMETKEMNEVEERAFRRLGEAERAFGEVVEARMKKAMEMMEYRSKKERDDDDDDDDDDESRESALMTDVRKSAESGLEDARAKASEARASVEASAREIPSTARELETKVRDFANEREIWSALARDVTNALENSERDVERARAVGEARATALAESVEVVLARVKRASAG